MPYCFAISGRPPLCFSWSAAQKRISEVIILGRPLLPFFRLENPMCGHNVDLMKTATMRQLRNETNTLLEWVEAGETVVVTKRSKPVLRLLPVVEESGKKVEMPDFARRQAAIFGDRILPGSVAEMLAEARDRY
jgi:prevent-host-death family protein